MIRNILLIGLAAGSLSACQTWNGLKQDFGTLGTAVGNGASTAKSKINTITSPTPMKQEDKASIVINDNDCPPVIVDPQLSSMSEFYDMAKPSKSSEVSSLKLTDTTSECKIDNDYLDVKIQLSFAGALGPKAKRKTNDRPFFAYPYFVAVTDKQDEDLAKELFAASVTYDKDQERIELVETIRQRLPLNDDGSNPGYQIKIGFQLSEEQLFYNASQ